MQKYLQSGKTAALLAALPLAAISLGAMTLGTTSVARAAQATMRAELNQPGITVSPLLYGIFFEDINHAADGGLYAELVRNRSFEDATTPQSWMLLAENGADAAMALDTTRPLNAQNPHALRVDVRQAGPGRAGVANGGYWGVALQKGVRYDVSLYARREANFAGPLIVTLENAAGQVYARSTIPAGSIGAEWKKFNGTMTSAATDPTARLVVSTTSPGTFYLDMVSLFPPTWKDRPNGVRIDLAEKLDALAPAFLRFPGGNFIEGNEISEAERWKKTIGDVAQRPGHLNPWNYRTTTGMGYHEYLLLCEDLKSEPMLGIYAGISLGDKAVPMAEMGEYVQDALDAIEYANGPVTSRWGAERAKNGHPAPFNMKFIEIGNENGGSIYNERYALFYDAIRAKYPAMRLIAPVWGGVPSSRPLDIIDEHYYNNPWWFFNNAHRYDNYDRQGPKIFVGEYAVTQQAGQGNLQAALGEAAFMTGMERNSDIVIMSCYAPLFVNVHDRAWNPDLIAFDSSNSVGIPSYYVQQLFSLHRSDTVYPLQIQDSSVAVPRGRIGVGTWDTQADFDDVKVTGPNGEVLLSQDFTAGAPNWEIETGAWNALGGNFAQTGNARPATVLAGDANWTDYTLMLRARKNSGSEGFLIPFRARDAGEYLWWNLGGWGNTRHGIQKFANGSSTEITSNTPGRIETGRWYEIKIEVQGDRIRAYLDNQLIHDVRDQQSGALAAVIGRVAKSGERNGEIVLKVVNMTSTPQDTQIALDGAGRIASTGTEIVLTGNSPLDENTLNQPRTVVPFTRSVGGLGTNFRYTFPPHSLTILRMQESR